MVYLWLDTMFTEEFDDISDFFFQAIREIKAIKEENFMI